MARIAVQREAFDTAAELAALAAGRRDVGAVVSFSGLCRDEGGRLAALEIEHYPGMADAEIGRVVAEAERRWPLMAVTVIHRYGRMIPGDQIVLVLTASAHRAEAFSAADFIMDYLKSRAPFWKREHYPDGSAGDWVAPKASDEGALSRWEFDEPGG